MTTSPHSAHALSSSIVGMGAIKLFMNTQQNALVNFQFDGAIADLYNEATSVPKDPMEISLGIVSWVGYRHAARYYSGFYATIQGNN